MKFRQAAAGRFVMLLLIYALLSAALVCFAAYGVEATVGSSLYYRLLSNAPAASAGGSDAFLAPATELAARREALVENNEGDMFAVRAEFPAIFLGEQWARLTIGKINMHDVPVLHGDYPQNLLYGAGHYANSRFPGQNGKVVLSAHVNYGGFGFDRLETMIGGEFVVLDTIYGKYTYRVRETKIFHKDDYEFLLPEEEDSGEELIIYTCYPYRSTSIRTQRFAIICDLISGDNWSKEAPSESD